MNKITRQAAKELKDRGYTFKPHSLYQSEKTAVLVEISKGNFRPYQLIKPIQLK